MNDVFLYALDTANLWNTFGGLSRAEASRLFAGQGRDSEAVTDEAAVALTLASTKGSTAAHPEGQEALAACARYLGQTQTFTEVTSASSAPAGHWFVLIYRFKDGTTTLRPAHVPLSGAATFLPPAQTLQVLVQTLTHDLRGTSSQLRQRIRVHGALQLPRALSVKVGLG